MLYTAAKKKKSKLETKEQWSSTETEALVNPHKV